jgi:hypothetical protein
VCFGGKEGSVGRRGGREVREGEEGIVERAEEVSGTSEIAGTH